MGSDGRTTHSLADRCGEGIRKSQWHGEEYVRDPHQTVYEVTERYDIFAIGKFVDRNALERFRDELRAEDGIEVITVNIVTPVVEFEWFTPE